ncbi:MAG: HAD family hydrolase [Bacillota bacterium]
MRLLALDIDHTLTGAGRRITDPNLVAVKKAIAQGVKATLITGRRYTGSAAVYADILGVSGPVGCHYGRRVVLHPSGDILTSHPLPRGAARALVDAARPFETAIVSLFSGDELLFDKLPPALEETAISQYAQADLDAIIAARPQEIMAVHVSMIGGTAALRAAAEAGHRLYPGALDYYYSPSWSGEPLGLMSAVSSAADKGTALLEIARLLGVEPSETVAMGDSVADIPMLREAGVGVAMPWADEEVQQAADVVAEGDYEDAVARAIEALLDRAGGAP